MLTVWGRRGPDTGQPTNQINLILIVDIIIIGTRLDGQPSRKLKGESGRPRISDVSSVARPMYPSLHDVKRPS